MANHRNDHSSIGTYGCWIGPDNSVHPGSAGIVLPDHVAETGASMAGVGEARLQPYDQGFVMARFERNSRLHVQGRISDLQRCREQWMALARAVSQIEIVLVYEPEETGTLHEAEPALFHLPDQGSELSQYLDSTGALEFA